MKLNLEKIQMNKHVRECVKICKDGGLTDLKIVNGG